MTTARPVGELLRWWRDRRKLSQLDLSLDAGISTRHLSFVETGRSAPSRDMVLRLAEHLDVPLRERNQLLASAGFAPRYREASRAGRRAAARAPGPRRAHALPGGRGGRVVAVAGRDRAGRAADRGCGAAPA